MVVFVVLLLVLYAAVLELSKNVIAGWIAAAVIAALYFVIRARGKKKETWTRRRGFLFFILLLVMLGGVYVLSQPPVKQVAVVPVGNPEVTEVVSVEQGDLTGVYNEDHTARIYAGIPYAAPPVGDLRWKEPQAPDSWEGVRACDTFAPMAMQERSSELYNSLARILGYHDFRIDLHDNYREAMSEDCLYLNVFAPAADSDEPLPVLFFIHGGSLMTGQSYHSEYRGETLASQGIIVVNFAYRLGVFGYYANEELAAESPNGTTGNYGLLDQIAALAWVRENIAAFGGDPDQITIAGESAGASSVNALCVSPLTEGMFERAIAESSGIVARRPYHTFRQMEDALTMGSAIMEEMNASSVRDLRNIPADRLIQTSYANSAMTLDGYAITKMPYLSYENGENHEKALLNGFNAEEADAFLLGTKAENDNYLSLLQPILGDYAEEAAKLVPPGSITQQQKIIIDAGGEAKGSLNYLYSAAWFTYSHELWSRYLAAQGHPVYEYFFTKTNPSLGNFHAGEMPYAYGNLWRHPGLYDASDEALSQAMQQYWLNFVKTGDPNGPGLPVWEKRTETQKDLLELGDQIRMIPDQYQEIYQLLDQYQDSK